jgi:hypothetical protein
MRRLVPPLFAVVAVAVFSSGRNPGLASRDVDTAIAVGGFALGGLGALTARYRRVAVRIIFAVMLLASSAAQRYRRPRLGDRSHLFPRVSPPGKPRYCH